MPTYRKLHTKIIDSYDFAEMPDDFTRVFWLLLIVVVDSEGRAIDNPAWLRGRMFPLREDVKSEQIENAMIWLAIRGMIDRYTVNGRRYFAVTKFKSYQSNTEREAKSTLPANPDLLMSNSGVTQELVRPSVSVSVNESVNASASESVCEETEKNIFREYESEIGVITPGISDQLQEAETEYGAGLVVDAIHEASNNNKRSMRYILGILRNWKAEGRKPKSQNGKHKPLEPGTYDIILPTYGGGS